MATAPRTVEIVVAQPGACGSLLQAWRIGPKASLPPMSSVISRTSSIGVAVARRCVMTLRAVGSWRSIKVVVVAPGTAMLRRSSRHPSACPSPQGTSRCEQVVQLRDVPLGGRWLGADARCDRVAQRQVERLAVVEQQPSPAYASSAATSAPATAARRIVKPPRGQRRGVWSPRGSPPSSLRPAGPPERSRRSRRRTARRHRRR